MVTGRAGAPAAATGSRVRAGSWAAWMPGSARSPKTGGRKPAPGVAVPAGSAPLSISPSTSPARNAATRALASGITLTTIVSQAGVAPW